MIEIEVTEYVTVIAFWLVFTRLFAIMMLLPIFDHMEIPFLVKLLSTVLITYAFFPSLGSTVKEDLAFWGVENFWFLTIAQVIIGTTIGFLVKSLMSFFTSAGIIITQQIGFGAVRYFDPSINQEVGPFEKIIQWTMLIVILSSGALFPMLNGAFLSFFSIKISNMGLFANVGIFFLDTFISLFMSALMLASPIIFINVLIMAVLGIISRMVPQLNIMMVSFVINIGLGLFVFLISSEEFFHLGLTSYIDYMANWFEFIK